MTEKQADDASSNHDMVTSQVPFFTPTDPNYLIELATCPSYNNTNTTRWSLPFEEFSRALSVENVPISEIKEGKGFLVGPCEGRRNNDNLPYATVVVIDADKSLDEHGLEEDGAPPPFEVHQALFSANISHFLYTTYSHGTGKGNRYRIVFPVRCENQQELAGVVTYMIEVIQTAGLRLALSKESLVWSQLWALPRRPGPQSPYMALTHLGVSVDARTLARHYGLLNAQGEVIKATIPPLLRPEGETSPNGVIGLFNKYHPLESLLEQNGYTFEGSGVGTDPYGNPQRLLRYKRPGSKSQAGVVVFQGEDGQSRCFSHHGDDPLNTGRACDSFEVFKLLMVTDQWSALREALPMIHTAISAELNIASPSVMEGSAKFRVGNPFTDEFGGESYAFIDWHSFTMLTANQPPIPMLAPADADGQHRVKFIKIPEFWKEHHERTLFNGLIYKPNSILEPVEHPILPTNGEKYPYFNTFKGWQITPYKGAWPLLEWHLRYAICGGVDREYEYLLDWFAHMVQHPDKKPGVALVLRGKKGWGKSVLFQRIAQKLGVNAITIGNNTQLTGRFNSHLRRKLLVVVEESFYSAHHREEGVLKHLISDESTTYEAKGLEPVSGKSYVRVVMITNESWAAPASSDERRYFLPSLTDASFKQDRGATGQKGQFFPQLVSEINNGGLEAFFWDVAHRKVEPSAVVNVPETAGLAEQRALTMEGIEAWLFACLSSAEIRVNSDEYTPWAANGCYVQEAKMRESLLSHVSRYDRERNLEYRLNALLFDIFGPLAQREGTYRRFAPLLDCRTAFIAYTNLSPTVFDDFGTEQVTHGADNVVQITRR